MVVSDCTNTNVFTVREEKRERLGGEERKKEEGSEGDERRGKSRGKGEGRGDETQERKRDVERRGKGKGRREEERFQVKCDLLTPCLGVWGGKGHHLSDEPSTHNLFT